MEFKKIKFSTAVSSNKYIYEGAFDISDTGKNISIDTLNEQIKINLNTCIKVGNPDVSEITIGLLKQLLIELNMICTFFPNGNCHLKRKAEAELKTCYLSVINGNDAKYMICIAFDETQPTLYKAELLRLFKIEK